MSRKPPTRRHARQPIGVPIFKTHSVIVKRRPPNQVADLVEIAAGAGVTPEQFAAIAKRANYDRRMIEIILEEMK